jgi:hypothetical protein
MSNEIEIFIVEVTSGGRFALSSVRAVEKEQTYSVIKGTQKDYFGWQYIGRREKKRDNVFKSAKEAAAYAAQQLASRIDDLQEQINKDRNDLQVLYTMLGR